VSADARRALLGRLIDHAALFPPASMDMPRRSRPIARRARPAEAWMLEPLHLPCVAPR